MWQQKRQWRHCTGVEAIQAMAVDGAAGALARLATCRDHEAWLWLIDTLGPDIRRVTGRLSDDATTADDAAQETLLIIRERSDSFSPRGNREVDARRWIMRVAANTALELRRKRQRAQRRDARAGALAASAFESPDALVRAETAGRVRDALSELGEPERTTLLMRIVEGLEYDNIAVELGCAVGTVRSRVSRALERLRVLLGAEAQALSIAPLAKLLIDSEVRGILPSSSATLINSSLQPTIAALPAPLTGMTMLTKTLLTLLALFAAAVPSAFIFNAGEHPPENPPIVAPAPVGAEATPKPKRDPPPKKEHDGDPIPRAWLSNDEYNRRKGEFLVSLPEARKVGMKRPPYALRINRIPPDAPQAARLDLQVGDLVLAEDGHLLLTAFDFGPRDRARTLTVYRPSTDVQREVRAEPGMIGIESGQDWHYEYELLQGPAPKSPQAFEDLYVACMAHKTDQKMAETALAHAYAAGAKNAPYWAIFCEILVNHGRHDDAIIAAHRAAEHESFGNIGPALISWTTASLAGARYDQAQNPPPFMVLNAPKRTVTAEERRTRLPSVAAPKQGASMRLRLTALSEANGGGQLAAGMARGEFAWQIPALSFTPAIVEPALTDQHISFDLSMKAADGGGYPFVWCGFMAELPVDPNFFMKAEDHSDFNVYLYCSGMTITRVRGMDSSLIMHPPMVTDGVGTMHVDLWWYRGWWEFDLDGRPLAFGPVIEETGKKPLHFFMSLYSSTGRVTNFDVINLGAEPEKPPKASDF
jgi:RNA polymerase sigma factor (sigma-70 family)